MLAIKNKVIIYSNNGNTVLYVEFLCQSQGKYSTDLDIPNKYLYKRLVLLKMIDFTCPKDIADHFNNIFVNVFVTLASKDSTDTCQTNPPFSEKLFIFSETNTKCVQDHKTI